MLRFGILLTLCAASAQADFFSVVDTNAAGRVERLESYGKILAQAVRVVVVKPGWQGAHAEQSGPESLIREPNGMEDPRSVVGEFPCDGNPIRFEQWMESGSGDDDSFQLRYRLTPSADLPTELIVVMVDLPVAGNAGQGEFLICDGERIRRIPLPAELPDPYHIAGAPKMDWCGWLLPGGVGLRIEPDGTSITGVSFQDNRQFGGAEFQAQFPVRDTRGLVAGRSYQFGLTLRPLTAAAVEAEEARLAALFKPVEESMTSRQALALHSVTLSAPQVPQYEKLELTLDLDATFDNPFDPRDIDVTATFVGPDGQTLRVPGFFLQDYTPHKQGDKERLLPDGDPTWKVRFAPLAVGAWVVTVTARDRSGMVTHGPVSFECLPGSSPGFVRRVPDNPYYMQFDNGQPYFAVGENLCWGSGGRVDLYAPWMEALGAAGGNYCRIWLVRWNMGLEWTPGAGNGHYLGLGKYSQDNAWRLDWVMEQARRNGIYCMLCLGYHGELMDTRAYFGEDCWGENPYNAVNGGPCQRPADFWTDEEARRLYKQRLRYYIARYGWDSHVLSWELWNEVNAPAPWVEEMAGYLQENDPFNHLRTTTYGDDAVWQLWQMDYTQTHTYGSGEDRRTTAPHIAALGHEFTSRYPKPFMIGEFGIDWKSSDAVHDPAGIGTSMHDGLWASVMTRCFGTAAIWYWDDYVHAKNMYREFTSVRRFVDSIPWPRLLFEPAEFDTAQMPVAPDTPWGEVTVAGASWWGRGTGRDFTIEPDGRLSGEGAFTTVVVSDSKPDLKAPLRFHVNLHEDGVLRMHVDTVSAMARLHVRVDGQEVWTRELVAGPGEGEWKATQFFDQWGIWQSRYDTDLEVPLPAGQHVIEIENTGSDWVSITSYTFTNCRDPRYVTLDQYGLRTGDHAILWLHDQESNWYNDKQGKTPRQLSGVTSALRGLQDGKYIVQWWDTRTGQVVAAGEAVSEHGRLPLAPPAFTRDIAAQVMPASS